MGGSLDRIRRLRREVFVAGFNGFRLGGRNDVMIRHSGLDPESIYVSPEPGECRFFGRNDG
jgi:hypothetical protein